MDTKLKSFSHSVITKVIVFIIATVCFASAITVFINILELNNGDFDIIFHKSYYHSIEYIGEVRNIIDNLTRLIEEYKSEDYILSGGTVTEEEIAYKEEKLYDKFARESMHYDYEKGRTENYKKFLEVYSDKISQIKDEIIKEDLREYNSILQRLRKTQGIVYYATDGKNIFTNTPDKFKGYYKSFDSYIIFDKDEETIYPEEIKENNRYYWMLNGIGDLDGQDAKIYIGFTDEYLKPRVQEWNEKKVYVTENLYKLFVYLIGFIIAFIYMILILGRKSFNDREIHLNIVDKLFVDLNLVGCILLITLWFWLMTVLYRNDALQYTFPVTLTIATFGLALVLSLIKHIKNKTFFKHGLISRIIYGIYKRTKRLIRDIYSSGSVAFKVLLIIIGYPLISVISILSINFFPLYFLFTAVVVWYTLKKIREFNAIKEGLEKIKNGDIHHKIEIPEDRELGKLAANINNITDGLNKAIENELKSERLKTELITNVSHDIRTPLTSIITYVDLLKNEKDNGKREEYIEIIDQKANRLKNLTDDLFEASKASSGNIPVNFEKIDIVSLLTQGLGELNDKIEECQLEFKLNYSNDKVYIKADGGLLWRAIENLLSNIFKYALKGSRVYIDIEELEKEVVIVIKNISAFELNISADELMERFKRGDESRSSDGSGLGLSIVKSLINIQKGSFNIEIDGDLFKTIIRMPKYKVN